MDDSGLAGVRGRILVIDDDLVFGQWAAQVLQTEGRFEARYVSDPVAGLEHLEDGSWDLVLTDLEMPRMGGLDLLDQIGQLQPDLPVAIITGHATVDRAVTAFRKSAAEFIQKPISATDFLIAVQGLVLRGREARATQQEIVLAIGAHPGDVEIGAAGTLLAHRSAGDSVTILTLAGGGLAESEVRRARGPQHAAQVIGARLFGGGLDDANIVEGEPTIGAIEDIISKIRPTVLYTHSMHDVHQAHRNTHRAAIVAGGQIGRVYCFQSATPTVDFRPTHFSVIDSHVSRKLAAIDAFADQPEQRDYLQPDLVVSTARYWSRFCGGSLAEPFEAVRDRAPVRVPASSGAVIEPVPGDRPAPGRDEPGQGRDEPGQGRDGARILHLPGTRLTGRPRRARPAGGVIHVRILIFHGYSLCGSGGNAYIAGLTQGLVRQGHDVQLLCQEMNPAGFDFVDAVGRWPGGQLRVERMRRPVRCTAYVPDIGGLLPVYATGYFPGYQARPFPELTDAQVADYLAANTAAVRDVISLAEPDYALANHLVLGPAILARALPSRVPYAVRVHRSALEWTVRPHIGRFGGYARHGLAAADVVLVGSGQAAEELWEVMRQPDLPARTRLLPPGAEFAAQRVRPSGNRGASGDAYSDIPRLSLAGHRK